MGTTYGIDTGNGLREGIEEEPGLSRRMGGSRRKKKRRRRESLGQEKYRQVHEIATITRERERVW